MRIHLGILFTILAMFPKSDELMLRRFFGSQNLQIYTRRYQSLHDDTYFLKLMPGQHKVAVDANGKFVTGYAEEHGNMFVLCPFLEEGPPYLEPKRIKIRIRGKYATSYIKILPNDPLNALFFEPISPEHLCNAKAIPNPADEANIA